jgi:hypothetical protein
MIEINVTGRKTGIIDQIAGNKQPVANLPRFTNF